MHQPPSRRSKTAKQHVTPTIQVHTPDSLGLKPIARRQEVLDLCEQDITLLVDADTDAEVTHLQTFSFYLFIFYYLITQVGGVQFMPPGCNAKTHGTMIRHHRQVVDLKAVRRGASMETFGYGKMHVRGSRQPQGGRKADIYTEYPELKAENNEDIGALFAYAYASI